MRIEARNLGCAGFALIVLLALDTAVMTASPLPGSEARRLSAQETARRNFQDEERMFMEARRALNREEFDRAAELFVALRARYPVNTAYGYGRFVPDSYYWEAFGRYRQGDLAEARMLLDLVQVYGEAQSHGRLHGDVRDLRLRIQRQLAEEGDPRAAEEVLRQSEAVLAMDTAAARETQRQLEARQREMMTQFQEEQLRVQRQLEEMVARYRTQLDNVREIMAQAAREYLANEEVLMGLVVGADSELRHLADSAAHADAPGYARIREGVFEQAAGQQRAYRDALTRFMEQAERGAWDGRFGYALYPDLIPVEIAFPLEECEDALIQQEAFTSLLRLETDRMPAVRNVLGRDDVCSPHLRHQAVSWLAAEETAEAQSLLTEVATSHPDTRTRRWAISSLAGFQTPEVAQVLVDILRESDDREIQQAALAGLGDHRHDQATQALTEFAVDDSKPEELREQAAMLVAQSVTAASVGTVFNRLDSEDIQLGYLEALAERVRTGELRVSGLFPLIEDANHSDEMRISLWQVWSMQPAINLDLNFLDQLYGDLESAELRDQLLYSLYLKAQSDEEKVPGVTDKVIDKMIELARKETDPEVRKRAIYWLGRTGSERAAAFLMEILKESSDRPPGEGN